MDAYPVLDALKPKITDSPSKSSALLAQRDYYQNTTTEHSTYTSYTTTCNWSSLQAAAASASAAAAADTSGDTAIASAYASAMSAYASATSVYGSVASAYASVDFSGASSTTVVSSAIPSTLVEATYVDPSTETDSVDANTVSATENTDSPSTVTSYTATNIATAFSTVHATRKAHHKKTVTVHGSKPSSTLSSSDSGSSATSSSDISSSTSSDSSSSTSSGSSPSSTSSSDYYSYTKNGLKGVNLGGWLVLEPWINTDLFSKDNFSDGDIPGDEFNFCEQLGTDKAGELLEKHYSSWITEDDFSKMKEYGLNAVRIPIGYWAFKLMSTDKYYKGKQKDYLEKAISWARNNDMYVIIDLHGAPGSQNGYDSSGHKDFHDWNKYNNLDETKDILKDIFKKYGTDDYKDVIIGIELVNEPLVGGDDGVTQDYLSDFYKDVIDEARNDDSIKQNIVLHDGYLWQGAWADKSYNDDSGIVYDTHLYMLYNSDYKSKSYDDKIEQVCTWGKDIDKLDYKEFVGEFTAAWDADSDSIYTKKISKWSDDDKNKLRKYIEAQFTAFEKSYGWFFWNWKMGDSDQWDFQVLVENDVIPQPLSDRKYDTC